MHCRALSLLAALLAGCASGTASQPLPGAPAQESVLPGTIGVVVRSGPAGLVVVVAVRRGISAVHEGDVVLAYNGIRVESEREFNRLVADSPPGSVARLELRRAGAIHRVRLPVRQLETTPLSRDVIPIHHKEAV